MPRPCDLDHFHGQKVNGQGHQVALLTAVLVRQAAAAVGVRTCWTCVPFDLESGVRVTCDVGYVCANFSLPRLLCSRLRPDVRDRQTSDSINA